MSSKATIERLSHVVFWAASLLLGATATLSVLSVAAYSLLTQPAKIPPIVTIVSPLQATYASPNVALDFSVKQSESWYRDGGVDEYFIQVAYQLDRRESVVAWKPPHNYSNATPGRLTDKLIGLENGFHTLQINVTIRSPYDIFSPGDPHGHFAGSETWNSTTTITFTVEAPYSPAPSRSPTSSPSPLMTANLAESASALNYGERINFTVTVEGGKAPYAYTWNIEQSSDSIIIETTTSPHYSSNSFTVGSHHVFVEVIDAENNSAKTLKVEFNVLPNPNPSSIHSQSPSPCPSAVQTPAESNSATSASPTPQPTQYQTQTPDQPKISDFAPLLIPGAIILVAIVAASLLVYFKKRRRMA